MRMDYGRKSILWSFPRLLTQRKSGRGRKKNGPNEITCKLMASKIVVLFYCSPTRHLKPLTDWFMREKNLNIVVILFSFRPKQKRSRRKVKKKNKKEKINIMRLKLQPANKHKFADKLQNRVRSKFMSHLHLDWPIVFE